MKYYERMRLLREKHGLTQEKLAEILGISKSTYVKYERGEREPRHGMLFAISEYFDVSIDYVLGKSNEENRHTEEINKVYEFIKNREFEEYNKKSNIKNIEGLISDYMRNITSLTYTDLRLDIFYLLVILGNELTEILDDGVHLFNYERYANDDPEYTEAVETPNIEDCKKFLTTTNNLKILFDNFISLISTQEYYDKYYNNNKLYFEKEISNYTKINKEELEGKFYSDSRYRIKKIFDANDLGQ